MTKRMRKLQPELHIHGASKLKQGRKDAAWQGAKDGCPGRSRHMIPQAEAQYNDRYPIHLHIIHNHKFRNCQTRYCIHPLQRSTK